MIITVKEAEKKIEELQAEYDNFMKLQNYALCLDLPEPLCRNKKEQAIDKERSELLQRIRKEANLTNNIRTLGTIGCNLCKAEIQRIQTIIDNSKINI